MGILENSANKAHASQKKSLVAEATKAASQVVSCEESATGGGAGVLGGALKAVVGGKLAVDTIQIFSLQTNGVPHLYVQPYAGTSPLPGEHHVVLEGTLPATAALVSGIFGAKWTSPDGALAKQLNKDAAFMKVAKKSRFEWAIGFSKIELPWAVQLIGLGDGRTQVVMQPGRYGGFTTYEVGFRHFTDLLGAVFPLLGTDVNGPQVPQHALAYDLLFRSALLGETLPNDAVDGPAEDDVPAVVANGAVEDVIRQVATTHEGKKVHVKNLPAKKEANVRRVVLPAGAESAAIVAVFDLTMFGSAKDAVVLTATHCYAHEMDDRVSFAWSDLESVEGFDGALQSKIVVNLKSVGSMAVPCNGEEGLLEVLQAVAAAR